MSTKHVQNGIGLYSKATRKRNGINEMKMLQYMCGSTRNHKIGNEHILGTLKISETTELVYWHVTRREEDDKVVKVPRTDRDAYTKNKEEKRPTTGWAERYELSVMLAASLGNIGPYIGEPHERPQCRPG